MKKYHNILFLSFFFAYLLPNHVSGQVSINNSQSDPDPSAMLDVQSMDKGVLIPRMTSGDRDAITNPAIGLMIYNVDDSCFNYFTGENWVKDCGRSLSADRIGPLSTVSTKSQTGLTEVLGLGVDASGNQYITGYFEDSVSFGDILLQSLGIETIFLAKYDIYGTPIWAKNFGGISYNYGLGIDIDPSGNILFTGGYENASIDFDGIVLPNSGGRDIFITKLDSDGHVIWAKNGGGSGSDSGENISTDELGNSYVGGYFSGTANLGGISLSSSGGRDAFLAKYDPNGNIMWAKKAGGSGNDNVRDIFSDGSGNSYVTGSFSSTATFDSQGLTSNGEQDVFVAKYDPNGNLEWITPNGGIHREQGNGINVDAGGQVFSISSFSTATLHGGASFVSNGGQDALLSKYDVNGNLVWTKHIGGSGYDAGSKLVLDDTGNVIVTGSFQGTNVLFDTISLSSMGASDVFVAKFDTDGNILWGKTGGGIGSDAGVDIDIDGIGNCYVGGYFEGNEAWFGETLLITNAIEDAFVWALTENGDPVFENTSNLAASQDADSDPTNEFQDLSLSGTQVSLSNGNMIDLFGLDLGDDDLLSDADADTKISLEKTPDEDMIRFDMGGVEYFRMDKGRLEITNSGRSIFLGAGVGINDDLSDNRNIAIGDSALVTNTSGHNNIGLGYRSLYQNSTGYQNIALGSNTLRLNTTGIQNVAIGIDALSENITGLNNTALGTYSLTQNASGNENTAIGHNAMLWNSTGDLNVALGAGALRKNTNGDRNTATGFYALQDNTTGQRNTAVGFFSMETNASGEENTTIGYRADVASTDLVNATAIGANAVVSQDSSLILGNAAKVGIGTSSPNSMLEVVGTVSATAFEGNGAALTGINVDDADADPNNELQSLSQVLSLSTNAGGSNMTNLGIVSATSFSGDGSGLTGINIDDADANPTNELQSLNQVLNQGNDAGGANMTNLGTVAASSFSGDGSGLTGININDADASPTNELQSLNQVLSQGNNAGGASMTNLGAVSASSFSGNGSGLTGINVNDADASSTNELQNISQVLSEGNNAGGADISNLGTVSASSFSGDGSGLTGVGPQIHYRETDGTNSYTAGFWQDMTSPVTIPWDVGDLLKLEGNLSLRCTGGWGVDPFEVRVEMAYGTCSTDYSKTISLTPPESAADHDNYIVVPFLDMVSLSHCSAGSLTITLQARNAGDDPWSATKRTLVITNLQ